MKKILLSLQVAIMLALNVFVFSPVATQAYGICGAGNKLTQDPNTGLCVVAGETRNVADIITRIINYLLLFAALIAILFIVIGGYRYITSAGSEQAAEAGKKTVVNAVIGLAIIILSYVIVSVVNNTLSGENTFWGRLFGP